MISNERAHSQPRGGHFGAGSKKDKNSLLFLLILTFSSNKNGNNKVSVKSGHLVISVV